MGKRGNDKRDRKEHRDKGDHKRNRSPGQGGFGGHRKSGKKNGRKFKDQGRQSAQFQWHNYSRDLEPPRTLNVHGKFRVDREDGTSYEVNKDVLKYTTSDPRIAYSYKPAGAPKESTPPPSTVTPSVPEDDVETPAKLLDQLKSVPNTVEKKKNTLFPEKLKIILPLDKDEQPKEVDTPKTQDIPTPVTVKPSRVSIKIDLAELLPKPPPELDDKDEDSSSKEPVYDIFAKEPTPVKRSHKLQKVKLNYVNPLAQISSLYDDEDEEDLVPTNALRIGSQHIRPVHVKREKKVIDKVIKKEDVAVSSPKPTEVKQEPVTMEPMIAVKEEPNVEDTPVPVVVKVEPKESTPPTPTPFPLAKDPATLLPIPSRHTVATSPLLTKQQTPSLDLLKTLNSESTEVDDFLQQIQQQRQRIEEKMTSAAVSTTPRKPPPKFTMLIDIDSVQKEINDKLEEMPDDFPVLPELPALQLPKKAAVESASSLSSSSSNSSSSENNESDSNSSGSSSDTSSSSQSSDESDDDSSSSSSSNSSSSSDEQEEEEKPQEEILEEKRAELSTPLIPLGSLGVDLTLMSRSPVMIKLQTKPKVIPVLQALCVEEEEANPENTLSPAKKKIAEIAKKIGERHEKIEKSNKRRDSSEKGRKRRDSADKEKNRKRRDSADKGRSKSRVDSHDRPSSRKQQSSSQGPERISRRERRVSRDRRDRVKDKERSSRKIEKQQQPSHSKKDRSHRSKSSSRKSWRRSRSPSPPPIPSLRNKEGLPLDPRIFSKQIVNTHSRSRSRSRTRSRSRSRSLSLDRVSGEGGHPRKRSPWRPPIDFWENLNVPTTSWAYNDEQYFSRAYYDESYNYFEQNNVNPHCGPGGGGDGGYGGGHANIHGQSHNHNNHWQGTGPAGHRDVPNNGSSSPMRDSLDDRINDVLNGGPPPPAQQQLHSHPTPMDPSYNHPCYNNNSNNDTGYNDYNRLPPQANNYYNQYDNRLGSDQYRQSANLLSINCTAGPRQQHVQGPPPAPEVHTTPFALQKGNVIEVVPSHVDSNLSSSGYQSEEPQHPKKDDKGHVSNKPKSSSSAQRKLIREKKRMEKNMRKKKLELELQHLLDGSPAIEINIEGEKKPSPSREELLRKVIFSDGVLPGDGTSDSVLDTSDDSQTDLAEMTSNQLKKYRKKKRKKRSSAKSNASKAPELQLPAALITLPLVNDQKKVENGYEAEATAALAAAAALEETLNLPAPPPPPNEPPLHLVQPALKREVMERPKKLLYFNTCHRERRMDFFSIFVPFSMFIRLNDPRLLQGHPMIVNRRRIPQPIYPPHMYPPPPQPFEHLPPVQISGQNSMPMQNNMPMGPIAVAPPPSNIGIRHIPTIGDN